MTPTSILERMNLPDGFGYVLLMLGLILTLAPWFHGLDFGVLKIPDVSVRLRRVLIGLGPLTLLLAIALHVPIPAARMPQSPLAPVPDQPTEAAVAAAAEQTPSAKLSDAPAASDSCTDGVASGCPDECVWQPASGPRPATDQVGRQLAALAGAGIHFSVDEAELRSWLATPEHTPYPAIADALLSLTGDRGLRCPVPLDVVVYYYEDTPGAGSPRRMSEVSSDVLEQAVVAAYNNQHDTGYTALDQLLR